ncbi:unnamed protein product [Blepharisma stoltei]|uniref:Kinesin motor domain-containing protein n=1 Tax=Blepharisma stoltei TaxID=1481888 RepID=A0AAU9IEI2_9CILI|nr:unnamed protein product [Blepharisma stoltei]
MRRSTRPRISIKEREETSKNIKVIARFRPLIDIELQLPETKLDQYAFPTDTSVSIKQGVESELLIYDRIFPPDATQAQIFEFIGKPIIEDVLTGYNGTVFAYGQTGSGKSFTMMGLDIYDKDSQGIIPRASKLVFESLSNIKNEAEITLKCSMLEIYKEKLKDLLGNNSANLKIKEDVRKGIYVHGLTEMYVVCEEEIMEVLSLGESNRTVASTKMNNVSSRSHQLFMLEINQKLANDSEKRGILNLVDLAGSEKVNQTGVTGNKLEEAKKINLSLSALGNVIHALTNGSEHIPYRDSKLTRLLQESLGGNYKTTLIVCCSPHPRNLDDTLNTLKFGQRAKTIKNQFKLNIKRSPEEYIRIINQLKQQLAEAKDEICRMRGYCPGEMTSPVSGVRSLTNISTTITEDILSPLTPMSGEDLGISFGQVRVKSFLDDFGPIDQIVEEITNLKQEKESSNERIAELEKELNHEMIKRLKAETSAMEYFQMYKKLSILNSNDEDSIRMIKGENEVLKRQVGILQHHLYQISERFNIMLGKLKAGENVAEWEFVDPKIDQLLAAELNVKTEESFLKTYKQSEVGIDIPIDTEYIQSQDEYAQEISLALETDAKLSSDVIIFQLKKQIIQSGLANSELLRCYYDIQWKYNLLKEKFNLKLLFGRNQEKKIAGYEEMVNHLHESYNKLISIIEKLETEHWNKEHILEMGTLKGKIIRPINIIPRNKSESPRREGKLRTSVSLKHHRIKDSPQPKSFVEHEEGYKLRSLETNLKVQTMFSQNLRNSYESVKNECSIFKSLLEAYQKQNLDNYMKEKLRWKKYLEQLKKTCDKELLRKQLEINKLHEVLGDWIKKYMELQEIVAIPQMKTKDFEATKSFINKFDMLLKETDLAIKPSQLSLVNSPLHSQFKKPNFLSINCQSGDISPPPLDD